MMDRNNTGIPKSENDGKKAQMVCLKYNKGDLIIKEGDYGISIYKIIKGKVGVFKESNDKEIGLATLGPGEVIGEMVFLNKGNTSTRSGSARALEDSELEVWHPSVLLKEYEETPFILKYITNEALRNLRWMNKLVGKLTAQKQEHKKEEPSVEPKNSQRQFYRKQMNLPCIYRPVPSPQYVHFDGRIIDISRGGLCLEVSLENALNFPHEPQNQFVLHAVLPNDKKLELPSKIVSVNRDPDTGKLIIGMEFTDLPSEYSKTLGFFMMR